MRPFLAGDIVRHKPSGEEWVLATDEDEGGGVYPAGWPSTRERADELELVERPAEGSVFDRRQVLRMAVSAGGARGERAKAQLDALDAKGVG